MSNVLSKIGYKRTNKEYNWAYYNRWMNVCFLDFVSEANLYELISVSTKILSVTTVYLCVYESESVICSLSVSVCAIAGMDASWQKDLYKWGLNLPEISCTNLPTQTSSIPLVQRNFEFIKYSVAWVSRISLLKLIFHHCEQVMTLRLHFSDRSSMK